MKIRYLILQTVIAYGAFFSPSVTDYVLVSDEANVTLDWIKIFNLFKTDIRKTYHKYNKNKYIKTNVGEMS